MTQTQQFDADMLRVLKYHRKLVRLCKQLAALGENGDLFDSLTRGRFKDERNNQKIRWILEDEIRELLWLNGDYKSEKRKPKRACCQREATWDRT
jgi:hypothetical protein